MGTTAEKLEYLNETKEAIKDAIVAKGVSIADTDTFRTYATKIGNIKTTPNLQDKSVTITSNTTTSITKDSGYDGLGTVSVVTNIPATAVTYKCISSDGPNGSVSIPANKTAAHFISVEYGANNGTVSATASKGSMSGASLIYSGAISGVGCFVRYYKLTNTTGSASTCTFNIGGGNLWGGALFVCY